MKTLVLIVAAGLATSLATSAPSRAQAAEFQKKLAQIVQRGETRSAQARHTAVTEDEVNSYLRYSAGDRLPVGVTEPAIGIGSQGRLNGRAIVDLDRIRRQRGSGGMFDPMSYLTGRLPLTASGVLQTHNGRGKFTLEDAAISGVPIPKVFLQEIVSFYTRTPDFPNGINIDAPFDLPASIRRIDIQAGRATIVQ